MLIQCGTWPVAIGVDWTMPISDREIRAEKKARPKSFCVLASVGRQHWLGFHEAVAGQVYAAALLVAMVKPNAIVFFPVSDEQAWVCAISDGMPVVGYDRLLELNEARNTAIEWSSVFGKAEMVGPIAGAEGELADVLKVLDEGLESKAIRKKQIAVALLKKNGVSLAVVAKLVVIVTSLTALAFAGKAYREQQIKEASEAANLAQAAARAVADLRSKTMRDAERSAKAEGFAKQVQAARAAYAERNNPAAWWRAFSSFRHRFPISQAGYRPQAFECSAQECRVSWQGTGRFTAPEWKRLLPNVQPNYAPDLNAVSVFPLAASVDALPRTDAKSAEEMFFRLQSRLGGRVRGFQADPMQRITLSAPRELNIPAELVAEVGRWRARLHGATALVQAAEVLGLVTQWPMRVTGLKYVPLAGTVDIDGEYILLPDRKG